MHGGGACVAGGGGIHGRKNGNCSGQYTSYWNTFLFMQISGEKLGLVAVRTLTLVFLCARTSDSEKIVSNPNSNFTEKLYL